jgi:hypothetical protein
MQIEADTVVIDFPTGQYSNISANITNGLQLPRGGSFIILSIFW